MSYYVVPHINTLIFVFGYDSIQIGYAGDFHPINVIELNEKIIENSDIIDFDNFIKIIQSNCEEHQVDSVIIVLDHYISLDSEKLARTKLAEIECLRSYYFMKNSLCHAFGNGKINGTVLCCTKKTGNIFLIEKGDVIEASKFDLVEENQGQTEDSNCNINKYYAIIDQMMSLREKKKIKKNLITGAIILAGDLFKDKEFYIKFKEYILNKYSTTISELLIYNSQLESCFTGASIFGINIESKLLFNVNK